MKADRLVATLLLLQARGRVTAKEVAEELEISERTARRDLEALSVAGIPVYSQAGRGGGWSLIGGARTDLTGLQASEAQAIFLMAGASDTNASPELKAAMRKLVQALPEPFRDQAEAASEAVVVDPTRWSGPQYPAREQPPFLPELQRAVIEREQVDLGYRSRDTGASHRRIHPLGLVTKASVWYLVADTAKGQRTFRVDRVASVEFAGERAIRPDGFDLQQAWDQIKVGFGESLRLATARAHAEPWTFYPLRITGIQLDVGPELPDGRFDVILSDYSFRYLSIKIAGMVEGLEIIDPPELRATLADLGTKVSETYAEVASPR